MPTQPARGAARYSFGLEPRDPLIRLAHRVFATELADLLEGLPVAGMAPTPEQVHELRIATRRLRVALSLFDGFVADDGMGFRAEFRWLGRALGELRDLDVYSERIAVAARRLEQDNDDTARTAIAALERHVNAARGRARRKLNRTLATQRFHRLVETFREYVERPQNPKLVRRWQSLTIAAAAHDDLVRTVRRIDKLGRKIDTASPPEALHRLRIKVKRLRYETEFYIGLYPALGRLARGAKRLQDFLGAHQDACLAAERLTRYGATRGAPAGAATPERTIEALTAIERANARALRAEFPREWRRFEKAVAAAKLGKKRKA